MFPQQPVKINCDRNILRLYSRIYIHSDNNNNTLITTLFFIYIKTLLTQTVVQHC